MSLVIVAWDIPVPSSSTCRVYGAPRLSNQPHSQLTTTVRFVHRPPRQDRVGGVLDQLAPMLSLGEQRLSRKGSPHRDSTPARPRRTHGRWSRWAPIRPSAHTSLYSRALPAPATRVLAKRVRAMPGALPRRSVAIPNLFVQQHYGVEGNPPCLRLRPREWGG